MDSYVFTHRCFHISVRTQSRAELQKKVSQRIHSILLAAKKLNEKNEYSDDHQFTSAGFRHTSADERH